MTPKETSKEVIDELCKILDASPKKYRETMTPKEKAKELVAKMEKNFQYFASREIAIQHALIAVDEIIESHYKLLAGVNQSVYNYWQEVKQEIELL